MRIIISRNVIGTSADATFDTEQHKFVASSVSDTDAWYLDGKTCLRIDRSIDDLTACNCIDIDMSPPQRYVTMFSELGLDIGISWAHAMPKREVTAFARQIATNTADAYNRSSRTYYDGPFVTANKLLSRLDRARINESAFTAALSGTQSHVAASFMPGIDGFARQVIYDRFGTRTGRMTIAAGPQILTLAKDLRNIMTSRFKDGSIVVLDYVSFEAQVALVLSGRKPMPDVYSAVAAEVFGDSVSRDVAKTATLSRIFGIGAAALAKGTGVSSRDIDGIVRSLDAFFGLDKLSEQIEVTGDKLVNHYGRVIRLPSQAQHIITNSYVQSTAADAALLGFSAAVDCIENECIEVIPLFVIHDALVLDCSQHGLQKMGDVMRAASVIQGLGDGFPVRMKALNEA